MRSPLRRALAAVLFAGLAAGAQVPGTVAAVRVYRGQALVTRVVPFTATAGPQTVTVTELPATIQPASMYATGGAGITVRTVNFRSRALDAQPTGDIAAFDTQIATLQTELARIKSELDVAARQEQYLDKLEGFTAPTMQADLQRGVLNSQALVELTRFQFEQRQTLAAERLRLTGEQEAAQKRLEQLQTDRGKLAGQAQLQREAVVFVEAAAAGPAQLELNYMVGGVAWVPAYIARLADDRAQLDLEYHAVLSQTTGEAWDSVDLTLSTSHPNMIADPPVLSPLYIGIAPAGQADAPEQAADADAYNTRRQQLREQIRARPQAQDRGEAGPAGPAGPGGAPGAGGGGFGGGRGGFGGGGFAGGGEAGFALPQGIDGRVGSDLTSGLLPQAGGDLQALLEANILAARLQNMELAASAEVVSRAAAGGGDLGSLAADYALPGKLTVVSRDEPQMLMITRLGLRARTYLTAVPLLSDYAHVASELTNESEYPLLPAPYNAYLGEQFAGRGTLPMTARGQNLRLGFGTDTQLRVSRELKEKKTEQRGGNQLLTYTYEVRVQNYAGRPAAVQIWERLPQPPDGQVTVTLVSPGPELSTDDLYVKEERPRGLLRWDVEVPAGAVRQNAFRFSYTFTLEFDRNYQLAELPEASLERIRRDFNMLQEMRTK